jgi:hypothetical protein
MLRFKRRLAAVSAIASSVGLLATPSLAQAVPDRRGPARLGVASVVGVGQIRLDEPNVVGDRIWFGVRAVAAADGSPHGRFEFRHLRPDGTVAGEGWAEVTCLQITGNVALFTAVVPAGVGVVKNHAFYVKIIDVRHGPDRVAFIQAQNGPERPPQRCIDFDVEFPSSSISRYPVLTGGYRVHGG